MNTMSPPKSATYANAAMQTRRVFVRDLELMARIGVYDHEKTGEQRIIVSVDLMVHDDYDGSSDQLANVLDYAQIVDFVRDSVNEQHINLIETLAERIAQLCLSDGRVHAVRVKIEKPEPFPTARSVGIEIERLGTIA